MWLLRKTLTYSLRVHGEYNNVLRATANVLDYWKHNATIYSHSARRCVEDDSILAENESLRTSKSSNGLALQNNIWSLVSVRGFCSFISTPQTDLQISPSELLAAQAGYAAQRVQGKKMDLMQRVTNMRNEDKGMMVLAGDIFDVPIRKDIVHRVVRWQLAKRQQGTHSTKTISEVSGTGKKPWKQKGTGRARHGSLRGPQFRHGATMHGPKPRSHAIKLQKKVRRLGLKVALSARAAEGKLMIFDNLDLPSHKTKEVVKYVSELNCKKILLVDGGPINQNLCLATQNLHYANVLPSIGLNVYSILQHDTLVMTVDAVNRIVKRLHTPINR